MSKRADTIAAVVMSIIVLAATGLMIATVSVWLGLVVTICAVAFAGLVSVPAIRRARSDRHQTKVRAEGPDTDLNKSSRADSPYKVTWSVRALNDLRGISNSKTLKDLIEVSSTELSAAPSSNNPDEGSAGLGYFWRRGIKRDLRRRLDEDPGDTPDDSEAAWNYILLYREMTPRETLSAGQPKGFLVLAVLSNREIARYLLASRQTSTPLAMAERARQEAIDQQNEELVARLTAQMDAELDSMLT